VTIANVAGNAQISTFIAGRGDAVTVYTNNELPLLQARTPDKTYTVFRYADFGVVLLNQASWLTTTRSRRTPSWCASSCARR